MRISEEYDKHLKYYIDNISFMNVLEVKVLETMAESKGQGSEFVSCSFNQMYEDFVKGKVTLIFWKPADDEDTMLFVER